MSIGRSLRVGERALTLLEVVVGLAILSLMAGAIYGIVSGSIESTVTLSLIQAEDRRVEALLDRTRLALAHLPAAATLELKVLEADPLRQEFIIRGVDNAFLWGESGWWETPTVTLCALRWPEERIPPPKRADLRQKTEKVSQRFSLAMSVPDFYRVGPDGEPTRDSPVRSRLGNQFLQPDKEGRFWVDLLPEIDHVEWRFYDPSKKTWVELQQPGRPPLIELRLSLPGRKSPIRAVFETI